MSHPLSRHFIRSKHFIPTVNIRFVVKFSKLCTNVLMLNMSMSIFFFFFSSRIFMVMVNDIPYMTISGPDCTVLLTFSVMYLLLVLFFAVEPSREHVFHVTFPIEWKLQDIFHLFSVHGTYISSHRNTFAVYFHLFSVRIIYVCQFRVL